MVRRSPGRLELAELVLVVSEFVHCRIDASSAVSPPGNDRRVYSTCGCWVWERVYRLLSPCL